MQTSLIYLTRQSTGLENWDLHVLEDDVNASDMPIEKPRFDNLEAAKKALAANYDRRDVLRAAMRVKGRFRAGRYELASLREARRHLRSEVRRLRKIPAKLPLICSRCKSEILANL